MQTILKQIAQDLAYIREQRPLIHHITNFVVMNDTANVTLHVGALPVMAHAVQEVAQMVSMAKALILNPGTLSSEWIESMLLAGHKANTLGIPIVLDPVGAGATTFRTEMNLQLLEQLQVAVIRGNSGEIGALSGAGGSVRGVESVQEVRDPIKVTRALASQRKAVVTITGKRDIVSSAEWTIGIDNGHKWLTTITGTGCMSTTMVASFAAVEDDYLLATVGGLACFGLAAELAADKTSGPASFKVALLDEIYHMTPEKLEKGARIVQL